MIKEMNMFVQPLTLEELKEFIKSNNIYTDISSHNSKYSNYVKSNHKIINRFVKLIENYQILGKQEKAETILNLFNKYVRIEIVSTLNLKDKSSSRVKILNNSNFFYNVNYDKLSSGLGRLITDLEKVTTKEVRNYEMKVKLFGRTADENHKLIDVYNREDKLIDKKIDGLKKQINKLHSDILRLQYKKEIVKTLKSQVSNNYLDENLSNKEASLEEFEKEL